jgi:hypothetical protein
MTSGIAFSGSAGLPFASRYACSCWYCRKRAFEVYCFRKTRCPTILKPALRHASKNLST